MARLPRLAVPGQPHHVIQRGTNQQPIHRAPEDFERMLQLLAEQSQRHGVAVHAYVLMDNHFHLLVTPQTGSALSRMLQSVGRSYVRYFNDRYNRTGALWQGRFKSTVVDSERYLFTCMAYIELNPVRAGCVGDPGDYPWSSYRHNIGHATNSFVSEHPLFWALGNTPFAREAAYREIVAIGVDSGDQRALTEATLKGWALGDLGISQSETQGARRPQPLQRGRPRKSVPI